MRTAKTLIRLGGCQADWADAQADLSLRWAHSHFVVLSLGGSYVSKRFSFCVIIGLNFSI